MNEVVNRKAGARPFSIFREGEKRSTEGKRAKQQFMDSSKKVLIISMFSP